MSRTIQVSHEGINVVTEETEDNIEPTLPLRGITLQELREALFVNGKASEKMSDTLLKLESGICNYAKKKLLPISAIEGISEDDLARLMENLSVISPFTLMLFLGAEIKRQTAAHKPSLVEMEAKMLEMMPDRFRARYKGNLSNRHSRELTDEESDASSDSAEEVEIQKADNRSFGRVVDDLFKNPRPRYITQYLTGRMEKSHGREQVSA